MTTQNATTKTATVNTKLLTVTKLGAAIRDANTRIVTLSIMAAYYTVIHGDVRFMTGWCKLDAAQITKAVRPLMAVKWAKAKKADNAVQAGSVVDGTYISDKKKRDAICEMLQVVPNNHPDKTLTVTTWDEFYTAALAYYTEHKDAAAKADLDSDEDNRQFYNKLAGMLEKALEHGVDTHTLAVMVERVKAGKEIVRKAKPSKEETDTTK